MNQPFNSLTGDRIASTLPDHQQHLADAQAAHAEAAKAEAALRAQWETLRQVAFRPDEIKRQIAAAQETYDAAMASWADAGAQGEPPNAPAALATLAKTLAQAEAQGAAAAAAAARLEARIALAQGATKEAHAVVGAAVHALLANEVLPPLVQAVQAAQLEAYALLNQLLGLGWIVGDFRESLPALGNLAIAVNSAAQVANNIELQPGGAQASRQQWREMIQGLFAGTVAKLPPAPPARFRVAPKKVA